MNMSADPVTVGEHAAEPFLEQNVERGPEAPEQGGGGRVGKVAVLVGLDHVVEIEKATRQVFTRARLQRHLADANDKRARSAA